MRELLEKTGLSVTEFARIANISRATAYNWWRGSPPGTILGKQAVQAATRRIEQAVADHKLPLVGVPVKERKAVLKNIFL